MAGSRPPACRQPGVAKVVVHELLGAAHHDHLAREARSVPLSTLRPASRTCVQSRCADHEGRAAAAGLGEEVLHGTAYGDHVAHGRLGPDSPEAGHVILGCAARIVGGVGDPCPPRAACPGPRARPASVLIQIQPSRSKMNWSCGGPATTGARRSRLRGPTSPSALIRGPRLTTTRSFTASSRGSDPGRRPPPPPAPWPRLLGARRAAPEVAPAIDKLGDPAGEAGRRSNLW